ncbi:uncharacterized protein LOC132612068 [Lycium barbarum]|uniref:uncharacterized protein LOC132612068 n=1 Tax=Lycium barbarum TaxID=112863 RepID=UPI00293E9C83|nr:uncharacterized protein LOC132612068 [Lycium barbarum]
MTLLEQVMIVLVFPNKFLQWILACIKTVNYTVLTNGTPCEPFNVAKGLRQSDPISPFLFAISMEYLSRCLLELKHVKEFKFHPRCAKLNITRLSFSNDLLLFSRGDSTSIPALHKCFLTFTEASGLQPNLTKSSFYFGGVSQSHKDLILLQLGYGQGDLPFKYLGIPLSTKKLSIIQWQPLINKITNRIDSWTAKKLSYAGRIQLVQSVIFGIQAYWAQLFPIHVHVLKVIDAYYRSYIWFGTNTITKRALVAWDKCCLPKSMGGMNLINLQLWNRAVLAKTCRDLDHKQDKLWIKCIHAYYIKGGQIHDMVIHKQAS